MQVTADFGRHDLIKFVIFTAPGHPQILYTALKKLINYYIVCQGVRDSISITERTDGLV